MKKYYYLLKDNKSSIMYVAEIENIEDFDNYEFEDFDASELVEFKCSSKFILHPSQKFGKEYVFDESGLYVYQRNGHYEKEKHIDGEYLICRKSIKYPDLNIVFKRTFDKNEIINLLDLDKDEVN